MIALLGVAGAGAVGAPARFLMDQWVTSWSRGRFPWGTFVVNASGAFLLGLLTGLVKYQGMGSLPTTILGTGFCGAYTTFSTFSYETVRLLEARAWGAAAANVVVSLVVGLLLAAAGLGVAFVV